jgi:hypothetical protein
MSDLIFADAVLAVHLAIIAFNVAGLIIIPVGARAGWRIVGIAWLRLLHLGLLAVVAGQALAGRACILTIWQNDFANQNQSADPLIMRWVNHLIYWNLPFWTFTVIYICVFLYVLCLSVLVPFGKRRYASRGVAGIRTRSGR